MISLRTQRAWPTLADVISRARRWYASHNLSVIDPGLPFPITRSSIRTTGLISRVVLVMNTSSADSRSAGTSVGVLHFHAHLSGHLEQERPRDALEETGRRFRRQGDAVPHDEEIRLRALGQLAAIVAHQRFFAASAVGFLHCECIVQEVVRLDDRVHGAGMVAEDRHERDADPVGAHTSRHAFLRFDDDHDRWRRRGSHIVGQFANAACEEDADVSVTGERGRGSCLVDPRAQRLVVEGHVEVEVASRVAQPSDVSIVEKRHAVVRAQDFVDAFAVHEPVIEDRNDGRVGRRDRSVDVDCAAHRHLFQCRGAPPPRLLAASLRSRLVSCDSPQSSRY